MLLWAIFSIPSQNDLNGRIYSTNVECIHNFYNAITILSLDCKKCITIPFGKTSPFLMLMNRN